MSKINIILLLAIKIKKDTMAANCTTVDAYGILERNIIRGMQMMATTVILYI